MTRQPTKATETGRAAPADGPSPDRGWRQWPAARRAVARLEALSARDRRSLAVLAGFLLLCGYYLLLLDPALTRLEKSDSALAEARVQLMNVRRTSRELRSWQADNESFRTYFGVLARRVELPPPDRDMSEIIAALMAAAREAGVQVVNLRPISVVSADGRSDPVAGFTLEANANPDAVPALLQQLWGMRLEELSLTDSGQAVRPLRVFARVALLTSEEYERIDPRHVAVPPTEDDLVFTLAQNPFSPRVAESSRVAIREETPPAPVAPVAAPPPVATMDLSGLKIVGVSQFRGNLIGIIEDGRDGRRIFARRGGRVRDYRVSEVDANGMTLADDTGLSGRLELPDAPAWRVTPPAPEPAPEAAVADAPRGPARMGVNLTELTPEEIEQRQLAVSSGLLVTRAREDFADLRADDIIVAINGIAVGSLRVAAQVLAAIEPGSEIDLDVRRDGRQLHIRFPTMKEATP